jgi:hypothetical protein
MLHRAIALCLVLLAVVSFVAGCARQVPVSLSVLSSYSGRGIPDATVTFTGPSGSQTVVTDSSGRATARIQQDRVQVSVTASGYQKAFLQAADLTQLPASIRLDPLYLGAGTVTSAGQPVAGATVSVWNTTTTTGQDGSFVVEGFAEGTYAGRVTKQGFADATFQLVIGKETKPVEVVLQEGQLLPLSSLAMLPAYELQASYHRTLSGEEKSFDGTVLKSGGDILVLSGDLQSPTAALMVRGGQGYVYDNGSYVLKGDTAAAAARIVQQSCEDLLGLPATFSPRRFTIEQQTSVQALGQECSVWSMSGSFTFEGEEVTATATATVGTKDALASIPVKIVLNARSQTFFDFVYDAVVEVTSVDSSTVAARFPAQ